jgi:ribosomal protein L11 methyltransferase
VIWSRVTAEFPELQDPSLAHEIFLGHGCAGTQQTVDPPTMAGWLASADQAVDLAKALLDFGAESVDIDTAPEEDWANAWKAFFKARPVGKSLMICPSWETYPTADDAKVIHLDPGQAFGTGEHPTTRLCIELMEDAVRPGTSVLDLGCGTGVLTIAASLLGAGKLVATEIEPASAEVAKANLSRNGVDAEVLVTADVPEAAQFDLTVSNIVSAVLIRMAADIGGCLHPGGTWILSGVIEDNWPDVLKSAERAGFELVSKRSEDGWIAGSLRKVN